MKDFAKSIVCNTKTGNTNKAEIIEKKKKEGATLKVDNGQKLEFSDGSTYVKTSFSDDYREAHNYTGNSKVGNAAKTFSGKYLDIYDNGTVVVKEGWAFGEKASVNTFERWLDYNIQAKEKMLKETKAMKEEFKKNFI